MDNHLHAAGKKISLTREERERMRGTIHAYMQMRPIRSHREHFASKPAFWGPLFAHRLIAAGIVVAVMTSSAGVSFAAESALPGDALYVIKTSINEPVRGALALTPAAKATWAIRVASERAQEAATLAAQDKLDETTEESLQESLTEHARIAASALEAESKDDPQHTAQSASRFEARLSEYERVLAVIAHDQTEASPILASALREERDRITTLRAAKESDEDDSTERIHTAARESLESTQRLAKRARAALSTTTAEAVALRLDTASATIAAVQESSTSDATAARGELRRALQDSERISTFLETSAAIHNRTGLTITDSHSGSGNEERSGKETVQELTTLRIEAASLSMPDNQNGSTSRSLETEDEGGHEDREEDDHEGRTISIPLPDF